MKRQPSPDIALAVAIVIGALILGLTLWWAQMALTAQPARTYHSTVGSQRPMMSSREQVQLATMKHGWDYKQWECLVALINVENPSWSPRSINSDSATSGVFQVMPNPSGHLFRDYKLADQARLGTKYIAVRYSTPCRALRFERLHNYY